MKVYFGNATQLRLVTLDRCHQVTNLRAFPDPTHGLSSELPIWFEFRDPEVGLDLQPEEAD